MSLLGYQIHLHSAADLIKPETVINRNVRSKASKDITGQRFTRLVALKKNGAKRWDFICDCGSLVNLLVSNVTKITGSQKSCGCLRKEMFKNNFKDLTGQRFNRLVAIKFVKLRGSKAHWLFQCDCGNQKVLQGHHVTSGATRSCGCFRKEELTRTKSTHGMSSSCSEYSTWKNMKRRCLAKDSKDYPYYGGRGITICERWLSSFENFYADMGTKPSRSHSIDRIDNNGIYEPSNCRWATKSEQSSNTRQVKTYLKDNKITKKQIMNEHNISRYFLKKYLNQGLTIEQIINNRRKNVTTK